MDTTDRQLLLDLVAITQRNNHPVDVDSLSETIAQMTMGRAQITKVMNLTQDPPESPRVIVPRIGDDERTATCNLLATHFTKGRLTQEEFDERSAKAIAALHQSELDALLADMPKAVAPPPASKPSVRERMTDLKEHEAREREHRRAILKSAAVIAYALIGIVAMILIVLKVR